MVHFGTLVYASLYSRLYCYMHYSTGKIFAIVLTKAFIHIHTHELEGPQSAWFNGVSSAAEDALAIPGDLSETLNFLPTN